MQRSATFTFIVLPILFMILVMAGLAIWMAVSGSKPPVVIEVETDEEPPTLYVEGEGTLRGTIVRADGSPNTSEVQLSYRATRKEENSSHSSSGHVGEVVGEFDAKVFSGETWLIATGDGFAPSWIGPIENHADGVVEDLKIVLSEGSPLDIALKDPAGNPVTAGNVTGFPIVGRNAGGSHYPTKEVEPGVYRIEHAAAATYRIFAEAPGFQPLDEEVAAASMRGRVEFTLVPGDPTTGTVIDVDGKPVADAAILLNLKSYSVSGSRGSRGWSEKEIGRTDDEGRFELRILEPGALYYGIIEAPDKRRTVFSEMQAGETGLVYEMPPMRSLLGTIRGDHSVLGERYDRELKKRMPYVKIDQRYSMKVDGGTHGELHYDYVPVEITEETGHFECPGIFTDRVTIYLGPYRVQLDESDLEGTGDLRLDYNLDTNEHEVTPVDTESTEETKAPE
ncbi:DUF4198 domain-containing protein [Rubinisphaera margarita]|uniref:DUF4198 domain-containing protein n=1 Tax=Rubinisphaera margarita TaxID=2909586 RepID=UPI001EE958C9|nr:DUF4198 domain-containing protein [Rubinisphaera margarita]MCG6155343.1 DUF4198 domain-containing protein [Rubinisphaera margarita]